MKTLPRKLTGGWLVFTLVATVPLQAETYTWTGAVSSEWSQAGNWNPNTGVPEPADTAIITSGAAVVSDEITIARLELRGGNLDGPGTLTVTEALVWSGVSTMQGNGATLVGPDALAILSGEGDRNLSGRSLITQGTLEHPGPCRLVFSNAARVQNHATGLVDLQGDVTWIYSGGTASSILNAGTFRKSAGGGISTLPRFRGLDRVGDEHSAGEHHVEVYRRRQYGDSFPFLPGELSAVSRLFRSRVLIPSKGQPGNAACLRRSLARTSRRPIQSQSGSSTPQSGWP